MAPESKWDRWKRGRTLFQVSSESVGQVRWRRLEKEHNLSQLVLCVGLSLKDSLNVRGIVEVGRVGRAILDYRGLWKFSKRVIMGSRLM